MQNRIHPAKGYHEDGPTELANTLLGVKNGIGNAPKIFDPAGTTLLPFTQPQYSTILLNYNTDYGAFNKGGVAQKGQYLLSHAIAMDCLDKSADYIDIIANGDPAIIILGGMKPTYSKGLNSLVAETLHAPMNITVVHGETPGIIKAFCESFGKNTNYGCLVSVGKPLDAGISINQSGQLMIPAGTVITQIIHDLNHGRIKTFTSLTKGVDYYFYFYVINTLGVSTLSVGVELMSL